VRKKSGTMEENTKKRLQQKAKKIRLDVLKDIYKSGKGHIGGTYSCIDLFVYLYYGKYGLKYSLINSQLDNRDRLVVGKGHACLALYNMWCDLGMMDIETLKKYGTDGSYLGGQLNINTRGVEYNTGSLGNAIGIVSGMALAAKMNNKSYFSIALIGDGECSEGSIWESFEFASSNNLNNLICIIDCNRFGVTDLATYSSDTKILMNRIKAFGWDCYEIDGHDFVEIEKVMEKRNNFLKPTAVVANTIKGKGVSFMEIGTKWHHSVPTQDEYNKAFFELSR